MTTSKDNSPFEVVYATGTVQDFPGLDEYETLKSQRPESKSTERERQSQKTLTVFQAKPSAEGLKDFENALTQFKQPSLIIFTSKRAVAATQLLPSLAQKVFSLQNKSTNHSIAEPQPVPEITVWEFATVGLSTYDYLSSHVLPHAQLYRILPPSHQEGLEACLKKYGSAHKNIFIVGTKGGVSEKTAQNMRNLNIKNSNILQGTSCHFFEVYTLSMMPDLSKHLEQVFAQISSSSKISETSETSETKSLVLHCKAGMTVRFLAQAIFESKVLASHLGSTLFILPGSPSARLASQSLGLPTWVNP